MLHYGLGYDVGVVPVNEIAYLCTKTMTMRALEFKSKIKNNQIHVPEWIQSELDTKQGKDVRVIVLIDDSELHDDLVFQQSAQRQFFKGYAESDSIYDNY